MFLFTTDPFAFFDLRLASSWIDKNHNHPKLNTIITLDDVKNKVCPF